MALQKRWKLDNGLEIPNAYIKIGTCTSTKQSASALVQVYANKEYADKGEPVYQWFQIFTPSYTDGSANLWEQAYEFIKTLPQLEGAENV